MAKKFLTGLNLVVLDTDPATGSEGELYFNSSASVAKIYQAGAWSVLGAGDVNSKSTSSVYLVRNNTGSTILKGTLVYASGAEPSGRIDVEPFAAVGGINSELTVMGMATANISNGVNGEVISFGTLTGLDTRGNVASSIAVGDETWAAGDILFAHPTVAGKLTKVRPQHDLAVAFITVRHASTGQIAVRIFPGNNHLEWMHDVSISGSVQNNDLLSYDFSNGVWVNKTAVEAGLATTSGKLSQFASTTSAELAGIISNETGSGSLVFSASPTFTTSIIGGSTFSAFNTTNNLTIGKSTGYTNITATNNILSGGTIQSAGSDITITDNYSVRDVYAPTGNSSQIINIGTGNTSEIPEAEAFINVNIGTGTGLSRTIIIGSTGSFTQINGFLTLPGSISTGDITATSLYLNGNLTVNGTTTTIDSATLTVNDKNIELGSVLSDSRFGIISSTATTTTMTGTNTAGIIPGMVITKISGSGAFGGVTTVTSVDSATQFTFTSASANTAGQLTFNVIGPSNTSANGGGITLKGTTDKTFNWLNATSAWTSSEHISLASGKNLLLNGTLGTAGQVLRVNSGGTALEWGTVSGGGSSFTSSAELAALINDETGFSSSAKAVFSISPEITTSITTLSSSFNLINTGATTLNIGGAATTLSMGAATGTTTINNNLALSGAVSIAASKNIAVASFYNGTFGVGRVVMTGTGSNPTTRPDGTSLVAGDIWIAY